MNNSPIFGIGKTIGRIRLVLIACILAGWGNSSLLAARTLIDYYSKSVPELLDLLDSKDLNTRSGASMALGSCYRDPREIVMVDLGYPGPALPLGVPVADGVVPKLHRLLKSETDVNMRFYIVEALADIRFRADTTPLIVEALSDDSALVRAHAGRFLVEISQKYHEKLPDAVMPTLIACLDPNGKPYGIVPAASALGSMGALGKPAIPALEKLSSYQAVDSYDTDLVRQSVAAALAEINKAIAADAAKPTATTASSTATAPTTVTAPAAKSAPSASPVPFRKF